MGQRRRQIRPRMVIEDGDGAVFHAGVAWPAETARLCEPTVGRASPWSAHRSVARRTLVRTELAFADGTTCLADLAVLRAQPARRAAVPIAAGSRRRQCRYEAYVMACRSWAAEVRCVAPDIEWALFEANGDLRKIQPQSRVGSHCRSESF